MLPHLLEKYCATFHPVVPLQEGEKVIPLNLSETNTDLTPEIFGDTSLFSAYINLLLQIGGARYGIGGYLENRKVYARSRVFDAAGSDEEPRTLHLGVDIWGKAGTPVMAPLDGLVHSTGNHPEYGNYGATIILQHELEGLPFYTLYGHLAFADLQIKPGTRVQAGQAFAHFGPPEENGYWPPHLHFQVMADLQGHSGDYPGVCAPSKVDFYRENCLDPNLVLIWG
jgi:murein DD-endopeptidase MepM/ murein hydrolase activator NlpD